MKKLYGVLSLLAVALLVAPAQANPSYGFTRITNNADANVASQLLVVVTDAGGGYVDFKFTNNVGIGSSITDIYFDDGSLLGISSIYDSGGGVSFAGPASPSNLPGGSAINFHTSAGAFSADSDTPIEANGVNAAGEWVSIPALQEVEAPPVDSPVYFKAIEGYRGQLALAASAHFVILD